MKKLLLYAIAGIFALLIVCWPEMPAHSNVSGSPNGCTGSPFDFSGRTCGSNGGCHSGNPVTDQPGWITTNIPACGYTPGQTYSISVYVSSPGRTKFGFSFSPQNTSTGATAGTLIAASGMQLTGANRYITHQIASTTQDGTSNSKTWNFQWTAPASGVPVTFYASMNATNSSNTTAGDLIFTSSLSVISSTAPALSITNSGSNPFCSANPVTLSASIAAGNVWTLNGNPSGTGASIVASESGTYVVTNTNGNCIQSQSITLTAVDAAPNLSDIGFGPQGNLICDGAPTVLSVSSTDPVVWSPGNSTADTLVVSAPGSYSASSTNVCGTSTTASVEVLEASAPNPPLILSSESEPICEGLPVVLSVSNVQADLSYEWNTAQSGTSISTDTAGLYEVNASNGCGTANAAITLSFLDAPEAPLLSQNTDGMLLASGAGDTFTWFLNGVPIEGAQTNSLIPAASGNYTVQSASAANGCLSPVSAPLFVDISLVESMPIGWKCYPQPAQGVLYLSSPELSAIREIEVYDVAGKRCDRIAVNGQTTLTYVSALRPGMYILRAGKHKLRVVL